MADQKDSKYASRGERMLTYILITIIAGFLGSLGTYIFLNIKPSAQKVLSPPQNQSSVKNKTSVSSDSALPQNALSPLAINFSECKTVRTTVFVGTGETVYEVKGKTGKICTLEYGGEIENPNWDKTLTMSCRVPVNKGMVEFTTKNLGVDFSPIQQYCEKIE